MREIGMEDGERETREGRGKGGLQELRVEGEMWNRGKVSGREGRRGKKRGQKGERERSKGTQIYTHTQIYEHKLLSNPFSAI